MERLDYLLEIGTEELPVGFVESAEWELQEKTREALEKNRLAFDKVEVLHTPRRLALMIHSLAASQEASEEMMKGPPASVALDAQGQYTQAAQGFARKMGVDVNELQRETLDGTEYLVYRKRSAGRPAEEILPEILPEIVLSLSGSHFMAWDDSDIKFSRPIRWLLSLLGNRHVPVQIGLVKSKTTTRGHRFFADAPEIEINSVDSYQAQLRQQGNVIVNHAERREMIYAALQEKAKSLNGAVSANESLLDTVTRLVETPALVTGSFAPAFLNLPKEVITTVMIAHQKYFPVESVTEEGLLPYFITISNNPQVSAHDMIRQGNEKVLRARLDDASFFFESDRKHPLEHYVSALKGITFQKGLGTLCDKTQRLMDLVASIGQSMGLPKADVDDAVRAATLCKADLATGMVRELTELQGVMGRQYAALSGEKPAVAQAIEEHYLPRFMDDAVASSTPGILLSLADKMDSMMAVFAQKDARYPTGSKDPMGLRRMALGIIQTILENNLTLNLEDVMVATYNNLGSLAVESRDDTVNRTRQFLLQRFKGYLLDQNFSYDTIDAVLECDVSPFASLVDTIDRLNRLKVLQQNQELLKQVYEPANRTSRILGKGYITDVTADQVEPKLFEHDSEKALYQAYLNAKPEAVTTTGALEVFAEWAPAVEAFFDNVLVNVDDAAVKQNRYRLLSLLNRAYRRFADFTKLVV